MRVHWGVVPSLSHGLVSDDRLAGGDVAWRSERSLARQPDLLSTLVHGLRVIEFVSANEGATPKQIAAALGLTLGTTYNLVNTLAHEGYVERVHSGGLYLGDSIASLEERFDHRLDPFPELHPLLTEVATRSGDVAVVGRLIGHQVAITAVAAAPGAVHAEHLKVGLRGPAHTMALGKVLLAALDPSAALAVLRDRPLEPLTDRTVTSVDGFLDLLEDARTRGFAMDVEEGEPDLCCVAAPIVAPSRRERLAIAVATTPDRLRAHPQALAALAVAGARRASAILGGRV